MGVPGGCHGLNDVISYLESCCSPFSQVRSLATFAAPFLLKSSRRATQRSGWYRPACVDPELDSRQTCPLKWRGLGIGCNWPAHFRTKPRRPEF